MLFAGPAAPEANLPEELRARRSMLMVPPIGERCLRASRRAAIPVTAGLARPNRIMKKLSVVALAMLWSAK
jgi:hypothetical protein